MTELNGIDYKAKYEELKDKYEANGAVGLYYELNSFINATVKYMRKNSVESLLKGDEQDPKKFERVMILIKNAKEHVDSMKEMKTSLGLTGNEDEDKKKKAYVDDIAETRK